MERFIFYMIKNNIKLYSVFHNFSYRMLFSIFTLNYYKILLIIFTIIFINFIKDLLDFHLHFNKRPTRCIQKYKVLLLKVKFYKSNN